MMRYLVATTTAFVVSILPRRSVAAQMRGTAKSGCGPLRVFILAGQSNMVGQGDMDHLEDLVRDPKTYDEYSHLWNDTQFDWTERDDVYVKFYQRVGKLKAGFYGDERTGFNFGPELEFGMVLGDSLRWSGGQDCKQPILLLKVAQDGRDLAIDFRPPSSGLGNYSYEEMIGVNRWDNFDVYDMGWLYRKMIRDIQTTLTSSSLSSIIPNYIPDDGYEISGFVWLQGWNDLREKKAEEYEYNLINLIHDVRRDLDTPYLPFLIGELGQHGTDYSHTTNPQRVTKVREAQRKVAAMQEFSDTTRFVSTSQFVDNMEGRKYQGVFHYYGRADIHIAIGRALGFAMLELLLGTEES